MPAQAAQGLDCPDLDRCAEKCLGNDACKAFPFEKSTKLCYMITNVSHVNGNSPFISGRLK